MQAEVPNFAQDGAALYLRHNSMKTSFDCVGLSKTNMDLF